MSLISLRTEPVPGGSPAEVQCLSQRTITSVRPPFQCRAAQRCVYSASGGGKFPININAVENSCCRNSGREIAVDEQIDAAGDHGLTASSGTRSRRKSVGPSERNQNFQVRMQLLELLQRGEIAVQGARVERAADAWKIRILIIGPAIRYGAAGRRGVAEGVRQMRELICNAIDL